MSKHLPELCRFLEVLPLPQKEDTESSPLHGMRPCLAIVPVEGGQPTSPSATARVILLPSLLHTRHACAELSGKYNSQGLPCPER